MTTAEKREPATGNTETVAGCGSTTGHAGEQFNHNSPFSEVEADIVRRDVIRPTGNAVIKRVPATFARCSRCGHEAFAYGQREASVNACLMRLRDECPNKLSQSNFYVQREVKP